VAARSAVRVPQLIEERMYARFQRIAPQIRRVLQQPRHQVHCLWWHPLVEYLVLRVRLDLRKLELRVVRIHALDLFARRRPQHIDDLHQLIDSTLSGEQRLFQKQLLPRMLPNTRTTPPSPSSPYAWHSTHQAKAQPPAPPPVGPSSALTLSCRSHLRT
jgi:hypothetical protein